MTNFVQETDTRMIFPLPEPYFVSGSVEGATWAGGFQDNYLPYSSSIESAWEVITTLENKDVARLSKKVLISIQHTLTSLCALNFVHCDFPKLHAFIDDEDLVSIEWIFSHFRIGFVIDTTITDSSWYLVSNGELGDTNASGYLLENGINKRVQWLISFIISNS